MMLYIICRHVQFTNGSMHGGTMDSTSGMHTYHRSTSGGGNMGGLHQRSASMSGFNQHQQQHHTMGGSRYNLHQPPLSPSAGSYYGGGGVVGGGGSVYNHQLMGGGGAAAAGSVYHGYGSRRGSMQSLVAASGTFCLLFICPSLFCLT